MSRYYRLLLDDYSTASFTSFRQRLLRYARPIGGLFQSVERGRRNCRATKYILSIYDQFLAGNKKISHSVAYREVPFLVPAKILGTATSVLIDYAWEHINTWECIYKMKCGKAESTHIWVSCYGKYCRCIQTKFTNLLYKNMVKDYVDHDECFLGFPHQIECDPPYTSCRMFVEEKVFKNKAEAMADKIHFIENPDPNFEKILDDILGNG